MVNLPACLFVVVLVVFFWPRNFVRFTRENKHFAWCDRCVGDTEETCDAVSDMNVEFILQC